MSSPKYNLRPRGRGGAILLFHLPLHVTPPRHQASYASSASRLSCSPVCSPENEPARPTPETPHGLGLARKRRAFWDSCWVKPAIILNRVVERCTENSQTQWLDCRSVDVQKPTAVTSKEAVHKAFAASARSMLGAKGVRLIV